MSKIKLKLKPDNEKQLKAAVSIFVILQIIFSVLMQTVAWSFFAYICVITSCLFCILFADGSKVYLFTQIGLIATVIADFFLVFLPYQLKIPGMIFFCFTQLAYFMRIYFEDHHRIRKRVHLIVRVLGSALGLIISGIVLGSRVDLLSMLSVFYYANLLINLVFTFILFKKMRILAIAFSVFIFSDTLIGFDNLSSYLLIPRGSVVHLITRFGGKLVMPLYLVAQVLIPISLVPHKRKAIKEEKTNG